jgi:hypothetical protein
MEVGGQLYSSAADPREKGPCYLLDRRPVGPQSPSGRYGKNKYLLSLPGIKPRPSCEVVRIQISGTVCKSKLFTIFKKTEKLSRNNAEKYMIKVVDVSENQTEVVVCGLFYDAVSILAIYTDEWQDY